MDINREGFLVYISTEAIWNVAFKIERQAIDFYTRIRGHFDDELLDFLIGHEELHIRRLFDSQNTAIIHEFYD